jgi:hypothetical protein
VLEWWSLFPPISLGESCQKHVSGERSGRAGYSEGGLGGKE